LEKVFEDGLMGKHQSIVIHEAAEAMGNLCQENSKKLMEKFTDKDNSLVWETCYLSKKKIDWAKETNNGETEGIDLTKLKIKTNDPSPPFNHLKEEKYSNI